MASWHVQAEMEGRRFVALMRDLRRCKECFFSIFIGALDWCGFCMHVRTGPGMHVQDDMTTVVRPVLLVHSCVCTHVDTHVDIHDESRMGHPCGMHCGAKGFTAQKPWAVAVAMPFWDRGSLVSSMAHCGAPKAG
jgi:hypothetical protein